MCCSLSISVTVFKFDRLLSLRMFRQAIILPVYDVRCDIIVTFQKCADLRQCIVWFSLYNIRYLWCRALSLVCHIYVVSILRVNVRVILSLDKNCCLVGAYIISTNTSQ